MYGDEAMENPDLFEGDILEFNPDDVSILRLILQKPVVLLRIFH